MHHKTDFSHAMQHAGLCPPTPIIGDGCLHRFDTKRKGDKNGWYIYYGEYGVFGDWSRNIRETWQARTLILHLYDGALSTKIETARKQREAELEKKYSEAAQKALALWDKAHEVTTHPYLQQKQVEAFGLRQDGNSLLIPLRDIEGKLWSLQTINLEAKLPKTFFRDGKKKGCFHPIGTLENSKPFFVAEGYATGASVHMATGLPVVVAFDAGNLEPVIASLRTVYPNSPITIAADNDQWGEVNTGKIKAEEAARKHGCKVVLPTFSTTILQQCEAKGLPLPTDWNDKHVWEGF